MIKRKVNVEQLILLHNLGKTVNQIHDVTGLSRTTIRKYLNNLLLNINSSKKRTLINSNISLSNELLEVLYGTLLGDSSIEPKKNGCRIKLCHGTGQEEYFDHKCFIFKNIIGKVNKTPRFDRRTNKFYNSYRGATLTCKEFSDIYNKLYINGKKTITIEYLNKLTPRSLAYWFMDDGSCKGILATNCFSYKECLLILKFLYEKYSINTTIEKTIKNQYLVYITSKGKREFFKLCAKYFIPSMFYKVINWIP